MAKRTNSALIRALKSGVNSLLRSEKRIEEMIKAEEERHVKKHAELSELLRKLESRRWEDEGKIKELEEASEDLS